MAFEKIVTVEPAFDKRRDGKGGEIRGCRIRFVLKGEKGETRFSVDTDWNTPSAREHLKQFPNPSNYRTPFGYEVGHYSHDGNSYSRSGILAEEWVEDFISGGTEWLWKRLEKEYNERFGEGK